MTKMVSEIAVLRDFLAGATMGELVPRYGVSLDVIEDIVRRHLDCATKQVFMEDEV